MVCCRVIVYSEKSCSSYCYFYSNINAANTRLTVGWASGQMSKIFFTLQQLLNYSRRLWKDVCRQDRRSQCSRWGTWRILCDHRSYPNIKTDCVNCCCWIRHRPIKFSYCNVTLSTNQNNKFKNIQTYVYNGLSISIVV